MASGMDEGVEHDQRRSTGLVKVWFALEVDHEGWPPAGSEGMWAEPVGGGRYRVDNIPWFVRGLACGDVVDAQPDEAGVLWATAGVSWSGRLAIRVIPFRAGSLGGSVAAVLEAFETLGVSGESAEPVFPIAALDVSPAADWRAVKALLVAGEVDGRWSYEEGCVDDRWRSLGSREGSAP